MAKKGMCSPSKVSLIIDRMKQKLHNLLWICEECDISYAILAQPWMGGNK